MGGKGAEVSLEGLDDINLDVRILGSEDEPVVTKSRQELAITQPIVSNSDTKLTSAAQLDSSSKLESISRLESKSDMRAESDLRMASKSELDIRPLVMDTCMSLRLAPLPATRIRRPYCHNMTFSLFGKEVFGVALSGDRQIHIDKPAPQPSVVLEGAVKSDETTARDDDELRIRVR